MDETKFKFALGAAVRITASQEAGDVIGQAHYSKAEDGYLVRYKAADGRAVEQWWGESAIEPNRDQVNSN